MLPGKLILSFSFFPFKLKQQLFHFYKDFIIWSQAKQHKKAYESEIIIKAPLTYLKKGMEE
jgi:hypothetical protein